MQNFPQGAKLYSVLMVCTGNICRSPTAEGLLRHALEQEGLGQRVRVDSAGTHDYHIGEAPDPRSIAAARRQGIDLSGLRARQVAVADFTHFDLLLAMDTGHLRHLRRMAPPGTESRLKLYLDFAPDQPLRDLPDPYYGEARGFDQVFALCQSASANIAAYIRRVVTNT